jgi:hypothetical protein
VTVRRHLFLASLLLATLLVLVQVQFGLAVVGDVWWAILSWDNAATHDFETAASVTPPSTDPVREARESACRGARPSGRVSWPDGANRALDPRGSAPISRSPPAAPLA